MSDLDIATADLKASVVELAERINVGGLGEALRLAQEEIAGLKTERAADTERLVSLINDAQENVADIGTVTAQIRELGTAPAEGDTPVEPAPVDEDTPTVVEEGSTKDTFANSSRSKLRK